MTTTNDHASSSSSSATATITATTARKVRAPGVPMVHIEHRLCVPIRTKIKAGMKKCKYV
jgi:hypothetical protein